MINFNIEDNECHSCLFLIENELDCSCFLNEHLNIDDYCEAHHYNPNCPLLKGVTLKITAQKENKMNINDISTKELEEELEKRNTPPIQKDKIDLTELRRLAIEHLRHIRFGGGDYEYKEDEGELYKCVMETLYDDKIWEWIQSECEQ